MNTSSLNKYPVNDYDQNEISPSTKDLFVYVLDHLLLNEIKIEKLRNSFSTTSMAFNENEAFDCIKNTYRNFLVKEDVYLILMIV